MAKPSSSASDVPDRYRVDLAYDGSDFFGWAKQPNLPTVAGTLLQALERILGSDDSDFGLRVAGRTDAGVHATGQVAHFDVNGKQARRLGDRGLSADRINQLLPESIRILGIESVSAEFDARFAATGRRYLYRIADFPKLQLPDNARNTLWLATELNVDRMQSVTSELIGLHDFGAFCKPREGATTIRELKKLQVKRNRSGLIEVRVEADAFCHNMVRSLVGALIRVGEGHLTKADLRRILKSGKRGSEFKVVAAKGLTLLEVKYPRPERWAAQVKKAQNIRENRV